jgi:DNA-binding NarL/FixJ family response regulator
MGEKRTRVLCVDDSVDLTGATGRLINTQADLEDAGALHSADGFLDEVERRRPDVVLMDLTMPGPSPLEAVASIVQRDALVPRGRLVLAVIRRVSAEPVAPVG